MQIPSPIYNTIYSQSQCLVSIVVKWLIQIFSIIIHKPFMIHLFIYNICSINSIDIVIHLNHIFQERYIENVTYFLSSTMLESINKKCQFLINLKKYADMNVFPIQLSEFF